MLGSELTPDLVRLAYENGAFPMGDPETGEIDFYEPRVRAILPMSGIYVSQSLSKVIKREEFEIRFDNAFEDVIRGCLRPEDNWITEDLIRVYCQIHDEGWAHSGETWQDGELVGGVYGLAIGGCFCAESMFHRKTNASKVALWALVERCRELGFMLFDAQIMNSHLKSLGALPMSSARYRQELDAALEVQVSWDPLGPNTRVRIPDNSPQ